MSDLRALSTQAAGESEILGLNCYPLGMNGSQVSVLKEGDEVSFTGLLQCQDSRRLEAEVGLEVLSDLTNETLEGELPDEELCRFLVTTNFTEGDSSRAEPMGLLHTSGSGLCGLAGSLGGELLTRSFTSGGLPGGLLWIE